MEENTTLEEAPEVFKGIAAVIDTEIMALIAARTVAKTLESGLNTKSDINVNATALRATLLVSAKNIHATYKGTLEVRNELVASVGTIQAADKKDKLKAKIMEMNAALKAMA